MNNEESITHLEMAGSDSLGTLSKYPDSTHNNIQTNNLSTYNQSNSIMRLQDSILK